MQPVMNPHSSLSLCPIICLHNLVSLLIIVLFLTQMPVTGITLSNSCNMYVPMLLFPSTFSSQCQYSTLHSWWIWRQQTQVKQAASKVSQANFSF